MLLATLCITAAITSLFAVLPTRAEHRRLTCADVCAGLVPTALVWLWFACICEKPGLTVGFDAFRAAMLAGMALWANVLVYMGRRCRHNALPAPMRTPAAILLLLAAVCGCELFICNLNWIATHGYTPVDLRPYLASDSYTDEPLLLDEEHTTLEFIGLDFEIYNLQFSDLRVQTDSTYPELKNTLLEVYVSATDESTSGYNFSSEWQVAPANTRTLTRSTDFSGTVNSLRLSFAGYEGEYHSYALNYTLQTVQANVPRTLDISWVRLCLMALLALAGFALRPSSVLWREAYLTHIPKYRPIALAAGLLLALAAFLAPFADRFNSGVATSFYNRPDWDGESLITFRMEISDWGSSPAAQYSALAHSILDGRLDLEKDPPEALLAMENPYDTVARTQDAPDALWDVAFYNGRYYVYFGITPCLLFQLPFEWLTGVRNLPPALPMIVLAWMFVLAAFGLIKQALRRWFPNASAAAYLLCAAGLAGSSQVYYLLHRPSTYEYAILCGAVLVLWALWQWMLAANTPPDHTKRAAAHLALGSLCMALVAGSRPQMVLFAALSLPILWARFVKGGKLRTKQGIGALAAFLLPVLAVAVLLMWYNAARFGSPFDFGASYNLTSNDMTHRGFRIGRIAGALVTFFLSVPSLSAVFPFIGGTRMQTHYIGLTITELFYGGAFACLPFLWGTAGILPLRRRLSARRDLRAVVVLALLAAPVLAIVDCQMAGVLYRYQSDWLGPLLAAAALVWLLTEQALQEHSGLPQLAALQKMWRAALPLTALAGLVYNLCVYFAAEPEMMGQNPALFQNAARLLQFWL